MKKILFFDGDDIFKNFIQNHPLTDFNYDIFEESLNTIDINKISSYNDIEVISLFVHSEMIDTNKLNLFPNLKMIATRSTGFNHIDLNYCQKRHITVCNVPRYGEATVAEFAFGVLLALSRKIIQGRNAMAHNHISIDQGLFYNSMEVYLANIIVNFMGEDFTLLKDNISLASGISEHETLRFINMIIKWYVEDRIIFVLFCL